MAHILQNAEVNGAPGWLLDGEPYVPVMAQAGKEEAGTIRNDTLQESSFFRAGCAIYTTWEHGPQLSLVWNEDGSYDWSEVDNYLRKIAALDPVGLLWFCPKVSWSLRYHVQICDKTVQPRIIYLWQGIDTLRLQDTTAIYGISRSLPLHLKVSHLKAGISYPQMGAIPH